MPLGELPIRRVLCATDLDAAHPEALLAAHRWGMAFGGRVGVVTVLPLSFPESAPAPHSASARPVEESDGAARARALAATVRQVVGPEGATFDCFVERGDPAAAIVDRASRFPADLIVVGSHDRHGIDRLLLGSVAEHVVRIAPCAVLVARSSARPSGCVLAACDLQERTATVLSWAGQIAARFDTPLIATHATQMGMSDVGVVATAIFSGVVPVQPDATAVNELAEATLGAALAGAGVRGDAEVIHGPPARMIVARAEELGASLIVVATHGRKGIQRLALGSVAEEIVRRARCNVLVVR